MCDNVPHYAKWLGAATFRKELLGCSVNFSVTCPCAALWMPIDHGFPKSCSSKPRVAAAIPYYDDSCRTFRTFTRSPAAPQEEVLAPLVGSRVTTVARASDKAAQQIVAKHRGLFPRRLMNALACRHRKLHRRGDSEHRLRRKIAVLDGNVARVLARLGAIRGDLRESHALAKAAEKADHLLEPKTPGDLETKPVMELGRTLCTPKSPRCSFARSHNSAKDANLASPNPCPKNGRNAQWCK